MMVGILPRSIPPPWTGENIPTDPNKIFPPLQSARLDCGQTLVIGQSSHPMRAAMHDLLDGVPAVGMQTFETPPVGTSTRGFLIQPETP
jgi:hypothetical protein